MQNPASPPKSRRTCPTCNRPVEPGYKFCETCGTQMPELSTCSKCGTQFIAPQKYCDLCGARIIMGEVPEADDSPSPEEETGPDDDQIPEPDEEEIPEPVADELPEDPEENIVPDEDETPSHHTVEIREPDTDALLEQFGAEYDEGETLESLHKPKPEAAGDALFLSPGKQDAPAKPRVNTARIIGGCMVLAAILAAVYFIGLPMLAANGAFGAHGNQTAAETTPIPAIVTTIPPSPVKTPGPAYGALVPQPTQLLPPGQKLYFQVQKNPVTSKISVIFAGSAGAGSIKSADIRVTHPDGSFATGIILPLKGVTEITLDGSKESDRVEIIAKMSSGETYRVYDSLVSFIR
jgi:hypothetical protein